MTNEPQTDALSIFNMGLLASPRRYTGEGSVPYVVLPADATLQDIERTLPHPTRPRGTVSLHNADSFIGYVKPRLTAAAAIYADVGKMTITAVLNGDDPAGKAGWGDWRAVMSFQRSPSWLRWRTDNGKRMGQIDFAAFIEQNRGDIRFPAAAHMMEIAQRLEVKKTVDFISAERLSDGARALRYEETVKGSVTKGQMEIPTSFTLGVQLLVGDTVADPVTAFLRYRIADDKSLSLWYDLDRVEDVEQTAFDARVQIVSAALGVPVLMGRP